MSAKSNKKLASRGKQIMKLAKGIQKQYPRKKWTTCVKEAGKIWKSNN